MCTKLHNEKTNKELDETLKKLTLSQALAFYTEYRENQEKNIGRVSTK